VFGLPRIRWMASESGMPLTEVSSSRMIRSPARTPARWAGVSSIGVMTLMKAVFLPDFDAQAAEFAGRADLQILERFGIQIGGVGVEIAQHAANGVFQQILVLDRLHIILLDGIEHAGERAQLIQRQLVLRRFLLGPDGMHRCQRNARQKT
jgi:hypothetical protein